MTNFTRWEKLQNVAHRLNADAYHFQVTNYKGSPKRIKFSPCPRSLVYMQECSKQTKVLSEIEHEAYFTECDCHRGIAINALIDMEYDDTYRLAHYQGTTWKLYQS